MPDKPSADFYLLTFGAKTVGVMTFPMMTPLMLQVLCRRSDRGGNHRLGEVGLVSELLEVWGRFLCHWGTILMRRFDFLPFRGNLVPHAAF